MKYFLLLIIGISLGAEALSDKIKVIDTIKIDDKQISFYCTDKNKVVAKINDKAIKVAWSNPETSIVESLDCKNFNLWKNLNTGE